MRVWLKPGVSTSSADILKTFVLETCDTLDDAVENLRMRQADPDKFGCEHITGQALRSLEHRKNLRDMEDRKRRERNNGKNNGGGNGQSRHQRVGPQHFDEKTMHTGSGGKNIPRFTGKNKDRLRKSWSSK